MPKEKNIHAGHRQRTKEEFLARGLEGWPDHKALELLLFYAIPQGDVNPLAHDLIDRFGSLVGVFHATFDQLLTVKGVGVNTAALILLIPALGAHYLQEQADISGLYKTSWQFKELLEPKFFGARNEQVYLTCLDGKMKLLACRKLGEGVVNSTAISTSKVMETALVCNASVVVLAHNHVSGLALPSTEDISITKNLARNLHQVGILLYDHFVFSEGDMVSMRESGYLDNI